MSRSWWPCGLRHRSAAARLLGLRVRISPLAWLPVSCEFLCYRVEVSATDRCPVQSSLGKRICLGDTLSTKGSNLGSNPELCGDRTTSNCKSHATACHIIFGSIYGEKFSHMDVAVLLTLASPCIIIQFK